MQALGWFQGRHAAALQLRLHDGAGCHACTLHHNLPMMTTELTRCPATCGVTAQQIATFTGIESTECTQHAAMECESCEDPRTSSDSHCLICARASAGTLKQVDRLSIRGSVPAAHAPHWMAVAAKPRPDSACAHASSAALAAA